MNRAGVTEPARTGPDAVVIAPWLAVMAMCLAALVPVWWDPPAWALTIGCFAISLVARRSRLHGIWLPLPLLIYLAWIVLSLSWSVEPVVTVAQLILNLILVGFGLLIAVGRTLQDLLNLAALAAGIVLSGSWVVTVLVPSVGISSDPGRSGLMQGLFSNNNAFGFFTVLALTTIVCCALSAPRPGLRRLGLAAVVLAVASMLASTSRTAVTVSICLLLVAVALFGLARARRPISVAVLGWTLTLASVAAAAVANLATILGWLGRDVTLTGRTQIWEIVLSAIAERPLIGYGFRALWVEGSPTTLQLWAANYRIPFWHAHNGYLDIAAQIGVVGLVLALAVLAWVAHDAARYFTRRPSATTAWPLILLAMIVLYNATEVIGFSGLTWLLVVALASVLPTERKKASCTSPTRHAYWVGPSR